MRGVYEDRPQLISDEMSQTIIDTAEKLAMTSGAENVTVRRILHTLGITNRVFYNRFHNIDEVLAIVYESTILKIRTSITVGFDPEGDFFTQVQDIVVNTLIASYEHKMNFNQYVFEYDSSSNENYEWWKNEIKKLILFGQAHGHIKELDADVMSHAIWCFIRGYNADVVGRQVPKEEAIAHFRYSFGVLLDGMRA